MDIIMHHLWEEQISEWQSDAEVSGISITKSLLLLLSYSEGRNIFHTIEKIIFTQFLQQLYKQPVNAIIFI